MKKAFPFIAAIVVLSVVGFVVWLAITERIDFGNKSETTTVTEEITTASTTAAPVFEPLTDENGEPVTDENGETTLVEVTTTAPPTTAPPTTTRRQFSVSPSGTTSPLQRTTAANQSTGTTADPLAFQRDYLYVFISDETLESQYKANKAPFDTVYGRSITMTEYITWANALISSPKAQKKSTADGCTYYLHNPMNELYEFAVMDPAGFISTYRLFTSEAEAMQTWNSLK